MKFFATALTSILFLIGAYISINKLHAETITEAELDESVEEFIQFYNDCVFYDGHFWRPVFLIHSESCPCSIDCD